MSTELIDVQMPDGTIIQGVPKGISQTEVMRRYQLAQTQNLAQKQQIAKQQFDANQPSLLSGFASEALKNAKNLGSAILNPTTPGVQVSTGMEPTGNRLLDAAKNALGSGIPGGPQTAGMGFVEGVKNSPLANIIQAAKVKLAGGPEKAIEQNIAPSGKEAKTVASQIAPDLAAQDPTLARANQALFDRKTFDSFQNARAQLQAAEQSVPQGTTVAKAPILADLDQSIEKLKVPANGAVVQTTSPIVDASGNPIIHQETVAQSISGHPDALNVLANARNELDKFPDQIPFNDLLKYRRQLDQAIQTHSGWKETASAADQAAMQAKRTVANAIRGNLTGISPELDAANKAYGTAADTMNASGLDFDTGRRISTVGKPSNAQIAAKKAAVILGKGAATGLGIGGAYELGQAIRGQ